MKHAWMMVLPLAATLVWACGDDPDKKKNDDDDGGGGTTASSGAGGATASGAGGATNSSVVSSSSSSSSTGGGPFMCADVSMIMPDFAPCDVADAAACLCEGCVDDGVCFDQGAMLADDCVCADCTGDMFCTSNCQDDGECNPYIEGCSCADCADHPLCGG